MAAILGPENFAEGRSRSRYADLNTPYNMSRMMLIGSNARVLLKSSAIELDILERVITGTVAPSKKVYSGC